MVRQPRIGVAILAAGASLRFGAADKLAARFGDRMLGEHVAAAIPVERMAPACATVIVSSFDHPCIPAWQEAGFGLSLNHEAAQGMASSVAAAGMYAAKAELDGLLIALADMPMVPRAHFSALIDAWDGPSDIVCSHDGRARMPPALFGSDRFDALCGGRGDAGARAFLRDARIVACPRQWLADIDTPARLAELEAAFRSPN